jgi:hypothetical protein
MASPEATDWLARITRELEPLQHSWQRLERGIEAAREAWRPHLVVWRQLSDAFVAARDRGDFRSLWWRLQLTVWIGQQINNAKDNPSHQNARRVWLRAGHLTPKQIAELLPYLMMDMGDLRVPRRKGRPRRTAASILAMVEQLDRRIKDTGELPTTAAKRLLRDYGFRGPDLKGRADHLVRVWRNRAFKSR